MHILDEKKTRLSEISKIPRSNKLSCLPILKNSQSLKLLLLTKPLRLKRGSEPGETTVN